MVSMMSFIITRNMAPDPTVFLCPSCKAKLKTMQKTSMLTCTACGTEVDAKALRDRVTETWNALEQEAEQLQVRFVPCNLFLISPYRVGGLQKTWKKDLYHSHPDMVNCLILSAIPADFSTRWVFIIQNIVSCCHVFLWYKAEQYFWKAQRRARGNKSYMHQVEEHLLL